ncbi:MAG: DUF2935 domain-containing protein [bacterium]|nr:DUF2935 domain-containing protein [bacterium]
MNDYVVSSLELHLFFCRIMKEHAFFLEIGFTKAAPKYIVEANRFKNAFEDLLCRVVECSKGIVGTDILQSQEIITKHTCASEAKTAKLTGAAIDQKITRLEEELVNNCRQGNQAIDESMIDTVKEINQWALELLERFIAFKKWVLEQVLSCNLYTINYPLLLEHIIREAQLYEQYVKDLECECKKKRESIQKVELFWDQIMMEHALFIRGLLDPTEGELVNAADDFAADYKKLIYQARNMTQRTMDSITKQTIRQTIKYRDFKEAGTKGINDCAIRSLIVPLLADHVLREANHYLRLLTKG